MSSDKSTPASGKPTGEAPAAPMSPRSYAAVLRGDPEAPTTTAASSSVASPWSRTDDIIASAQKSLAESRRITAPYVAAAKKRQEQEAAAKKKEEQEAAASKANASVASSSTANASVASTSPTTVLPTSAAASSTAAPLMSTVSMTLCGESERLRIGWEAMKAKMAMEGEQAPPTTVPIPIRRREAAPSSSMSTAPQPEVQRSPSPAATSPIRAPAPSSSALPSPLGAVENMELCAMAEGVFRGTHRVLYGAPVAPIAASSPNAPPAASSSPIPPPAASSRPLPVQAPTYEVPAAWFADLEPLGWEVSASKSSKASRQNASTVEDSESLETPEASGQAADQIHREDALATPDITLSPQQPAASPVQASPKQQEPVNADSTASIPYDDSEDMDQAESSGNATNSLETPPKTPETSGQAAVRALHDDINATENILEKGTREYIDFEGTPEKPILDATEPSPSSGSFKDPSWYAKKTFRTPTPSKQAESPEESPKTRRLIESDDEDISDDAESDNDDNEAPKPAPATPRSPAKRPRSPTPERPEVRPILQAIRRNRRVRSAPGTTEAPLISVAQRQEIMRHKEHRCPDCDQECRYVNMDDTSEPPATPRSEHTLTLEPVYDVAPMDDMDFEEPAEDAVANVAGAALPVDFEMPPLEPYSPPVSPVRRTASRSISPMSGVSEVSLASSSRPASPIRDNFCPRCHRDCNCPHIDNPNVEFAPAPVRRRGPRRLTTEEAWARMATVTDIIGVDLPAPEPVIRDEPWMVIDNGPLTADRQVQTIRRPTFQLVLYDTGIVVLRGTFRGVSLNSKLLTMAAKQPTVIFNDPEDPADQIAAGYNHIVVRTQRGRLFTFGRGIEGQLGATKKPRRIRQATANLASMRRFVPDDADVVFTDIKASGNWTKAKAESGAWYACGEGHKTLLTKVVRRIRD